MDVEIMDGAGEKVLLSSLSPGECFCVGADAERLSGAVVFRVLSAPKVPAPHEGLFWVCRADAGELMQMSGSLPVQRVYARLSVWLNEPDD